MLERALAYENLLKIQLNRCYIIHLIENFTSQFIGIAPKNGGQVFKQLLIDEKYDLSLFESPTGNEFQIWRKKLRWALAEMLFYFLY